MLTIDITTEQLREMCRKTKLLNYLQTALKHVRETAHETGTTKKKSEKSYH